MGESVISANVVSDRCMGVAETAYVAGILDGEGTLTLGSRKAQNRRSHSLVAIMRVSNTDLDMLQALVKMTGNGAIRLSDGAENRRPLYRWELSPNQIRHILPQIQPYLITKKRRAELLTRYLEISQVKTGPKRFYDEEIEEILAISEEMAMENQRGKYHSYLQDFKLRDPKPVPLCEVDGCARKRYSESEGPYCWRHWLERREPVWGQCEQCGGPMDIVRPTKRFCGKKCQAAFYQQKIRGPAERKSRTLKAW